MLSGMFRLRRRTVSARFTVLYASVFLGSGATLLALVFLLSGVQVGDIVPTGGVRRPPAHVPQDRQLFISAASALIMMAVVSLVTGRVMAGRVLRPLRLITVATRRITADCLHRRLAVSGPADEVKDLADTIDDLLERLETSFAAQRRFVANASHELRTPLSTMRAALDVAVAKPHAPPSTVGLAERLRAQLDRVDRLLDGFLVLARAQHGALADADTVDLGDLISSALRQRLPEIRDKHLTVTAEVPPETTTRGSPALLARLVENVVDNAVRHNQRRGWIRLTGVARPGEVVLTVDTGGPRLKQSDVDRLAQPFERLETTPRLDGGSPPTKQAAGHPPDSIMTEQPALAPASPSGKASLDHQPAATSSGLGLSIVSAVAAAHGGRLHLTARPSGGLRVTVTLAAAP